VVPEEPATHLTGKVKPGPWESITSALSFLAASIFSLAAAEPLGRPIVTFSSDCYENVAENDMDLWRPCLELRRRGCWRKPTFDSLCGQCSGVCSLHVA
jgi:hypothetical protein